MLAKIIVRLSAVLLVAGLLASQILLGGWWYPVLAAPGYLLAAAAAVLAGVACWKLHRAPGAWCVGITLLAAVYFFWRQAVSPDPYVAREDQWLLAGALAVYLAVAWQLRDETSRWIVLGALFAALVAQVVLVAAQFTAEAPFHPFAGWALQLQLPRGGGHLLNHGWVSGTFANRTALAGVMEVVTFLALGQLVWGRGGPALKMVLFWVTAAGFAGLALSLSRSAYFGVPAGLVMFAVASFFVLHRGAYVHRGWLGAGALVLVVLTLGLGLAVAGESTLVQVRLTDLVLDEYRENLWFGTVPAMLSLDPWVGIGANMFDQFSFRHRGNGFIARPVHAHSDWLQLLIEYGRIGLVLGASVFAVHIAAGWRGALRIARLEAPTGLLPQSMDLGLITGGMGALTSIAVHVLFDYSLHIPSVTLLVALLAGWLASCATSGAPPVLLPWWMRVFGAMPAVAGVAVFLLVWPHAEAEHRALDAENALLSGDPARAWDLAQEGLALQGGNPRLWTVAGDAAGAMGNSASDPAEKSGWYRRSADSFARVVELRPYFPYGLREYALVLSWSGEAERALPWHLRAIARDPGHASGYEYLGVHYWTLGRPDEAARLMHFARRLPGARVAREFLPLIEEQQRGY